MAPSVKLIMKRWAVWCWQSQHNVTIWSICVLHDSALT